LPRNRCPFSAGIAVRFAQESVSVFSRNECPFWARICNFEDWALLFGDKVMASAIIDRIIHHAVLIKITGESYRLRKARINISNMKTDQPKGKEP